jgi:Coenzyme PQQ synthesis protein D (PqqD)
MPFTDKYVARSSAIASRILGGEAIVMSTVDSTLFSLNPTGTVIWEAADGKTPLSRIVEEKVTAEFDVSPEQARDDAQEFVDKLAEHGILLVSDQPIPQSNLQSGKDIE